LPSVGVPWNSLWLSIGMYLKRSWVVSGISARCNLLMRDDPQESWMSVAGRCGRWPKGSAIHQHQNTTASNIDVDLLRWSFWPWISFPATSKASRAAKGTVLNSTSMRPGQRQSILSVVRLSCTAYGAEIGTGYAPYACGAGTQPSSRPAGF
jgi:hypothetical protein